MAQIVTYVGLGLLAITVIVIACNLLKGLFKGLKKTVGSLVVIITSALLAGIVTSIVCTPKSSLIVAIIETVKGSIAGIQDIFAIEELSETLSHYLSMLIAPFFFVIVYAFISILVSIAVSISLKFIHIKQPPKSVDRLGGMGVGLVCGIAVSLIVLMPVAGLLDIVANVGEEMLAVEQSESSYASTAEETNADAVMEEISGAIVAVSENKIIGAHRVGSGWLFNLLASTDFEGERVYLKDDITVMLNITNDVMSIVQNFQSFGEEQVDSINSAIDELDSSPLLKHTLSGALSNVAGKWSRGEEFLGMAKFDCGELFNPMVDTLLGVLSTTTKNTLSSDLYTMSDMVGVLAKHGIFSGEGDFESILNKLAKSGVVSELIITANHNPRMSVLSDQITLFGIRSLTTTLGIPDSVDDRHNMIMSDIANALLESGHLSAKEREQFVSQRIFDAFEKYGVEADEVAAAEIAAGLIYDFASNSEVDGSDVREFFLLYSAASRNNVMYSESGAEIDLLSDDDQNELRINSNQTISIGDVVLENYNYYNYSSSAAYKMGEENVDIGDAATLHSAKAMKSSVVTLDEILEDVRKYNDCEDPDGEARKLSDMFSNAVDMFVGDGMNDLTHNQIIERIGVLLDKMVDSELFGSSSVQRLLRAILQSEKIRDELHLSLRDVNLFADKVNNAVNNSSYAHVTGTVSDTIDMMVSITDNSLTDDEKKEKTQKLLSNMNQDSAEMLSAMVSPSLMMSYGTPESRAEKASDSISLLFDNMASFSTGVGVNASDEEYEKEARAVNRVLELAMEGSESDGDDRSLFTRGDQEGKMNITVDEFVELMAGSVVVSQSVTETVYVQNNGESPYGVTTGDEEKAELTAAILKYYDENKTAENDTELQKTLNAIAIIIDTDVPFELDVE
jgi:hypothetical protein